MAGVIVFVGAVKATDAVSDILFSELQRADRFDVIAGSSVIRMVLACVAFAVALRQPEALIKAVALQTIFTALVLVLWDLPAVVRLRPNGGPLLIWDLRSMGVINATALPLALASFLAALSGVVSRYFLQAQYGSATVGLFAVAYAPLTMLSALGVGVVQTVLAPASALLRSGRVFEFRSLAGKAQVVLVAAGVTSIVVFGSVGERLLATLFAPEYSRVVPVLLLMLSGFVLSSLAVVGSTALTAARAFKQQLLIRATSLCVQVVGC